MARRETPAVRPRRTCWRARRWSSCAARAASARRRSPPRSGSPPPSTRAARCWCSPSTRPGASPTRSASARSATPTTRVPDAAFAAAGVEPRGELWAAMLDTKAGWDELIRRHAPDAEAARRGAGQPAVPEHHQPLRAQPRLPRHGAAARPARVGQYDLVDRRHAAVAQRPRRPRRAGADGRVLRQPAAALADRAVPVAAVHRGVEAVLPGRRPGARARGSCRTSPSSSCSSRRWRRASSPGPARSRRCSSTRARRSSS